MNPRTLDRREKSAGLDPALEAVGRRKWLAVIVFLSLFGGAVSLTVSLPDLYRATATVLVERQQVSEQFVRPSVTAELETRIQIIQQQVMSRGRLTELISGFDLYPELRASAPPETLVSRMRRDLRLELKGVEQQFSGRNATIAFTISYIGREPQTVAAVANTVAGLYLEENSKIREGQAAETADFLKGQVAAVKADLDAQERRTSGFKLSHVGELPQQLQVNLASIERLNTQLRLNGENQIRVIDRRERFEKQLAEAPSTVAPSAAEPEELTKLKQRLGDLEARFTDAYPDVIRLRSEIAAFEQRGGKQASAPAAAAQPDPALRIRQAIADVDRELSALKAEEQTLRLAIASYEQRLDNVPKRQEEYDALSRDYESTKERYSTLLKRYEDAQVAESLEQGKKMEQFRILDAAIPPRDPAGPNRLRLLIVAFVLAIGAAAAAVAAAEKFDTAFHNIDDLRAFVTRATVVRVPLILTAADTRRQWLRFALVATSAAVALAVIIAGAHHIASGNEQIVRLIERGNV